MFGEYFIGIVQLLVVLSFGTPQRKTVGFESHMINHTIVIIIIGHNTGLKENTNIVKNTI